MEKKINEWEKVVDNIYKFENVDDQIEGKLLKKEIGQVYNNEVYHIETNVGTWVIFSTVVMASRMASVQEGDYVKIVYTGSTPSKKAGQQDTKLFDVFKKKQ